MTNVPWKVILDPESPVTKLSHGKRYCFIVVDQFCDAYNTSDASIDEVTQPYGIPIDTNNCNWNQVGNKITHVSPTIPADFCDPNIGVGSMISQCFSVSMPDPKHPGQVLRVVLEPCPFKIDYKAKDGPIRTSDGGKTVWG